MSQESNSGGQGSQAPGLQRAQSSISSEAPLAADEFDHLRQALGNNYDSQLSGGALLNTPQPSTSSAPQQPVEAHLWSNLKDPSVVIRQDTLEVNPLCVDPNQVQVTMINPNTNNVKFEQGAVAQNDWGNLEENGHAQQQQGHHLQVDAIQFGPEDFKVMQNQQSGPTAQNLCVDDFPGAFNFNVQFTTLAQTKSKHWDYSKPLNKLYIDMDKYVLAQFHVGENPLEGLCIRATPLYAVAGFFTSPVRRCPNHAVRTNPNNRENPGISDHLIRFDNERAIYEEDPESKRLTVIAEVYQPSVGSTSFNVPLKFMCLGSDVGGLNRKPLKVIFTLEYGTGNVVGRCTVDVRICSCPKRDKQQEEKKYYETKQEVQKAATNLCQRNSSLVFTQPPDKKRRVEHNVEEMIMIPVSKKDFQNINEIAESLMVNRNINRKEEIKLKRRQLLRQHNPHTFVPPQKPKTDA